MKTIQILGTGCAKCQNLAAAAERAASEAKIEAVVIKVREISDILTFEGVSALPALAIDGRVRLCGRVPGIEELKQMLA